jgi:hypothetical protein
MSTAVTATKTACTEASPAQVATEALLAYAMRPDAGDRAGQHISFWLKRTDALVRLKQTRVALGKEAACATEALQRAKDACAAADRALSQARTAVRAYAASHPFRGLVQVQRRKLAALRQKAKDLQSVSDAATAAAAPQALAQSRRDAAAEACASATAVYDHQLFVEVHRLRLLLRVALDAATAHTARYRSADHDSLCNMSTQFEDKIEAVDGDLKMAAVMCTSNPANDGLALAHQRLKTKVEELRRGQVECDRRVKEDNDVYGRARAKEAAFRSVDKLLLTAVYGAGIHRIAVYSDGLRAFKQMVAHVTSRHGACGYVRHRRRSNTVYNEVLSRV